MPQRKPFKIKLVPDPDLVLPYPRYYSNFVEVNHTPFDFALRFCDVLPIYEKPEELQRGKELEKRIPIKAEIVIPKDVFPNLIKTMQEQYDRYMKDYGGDKKISE